MKRTISKMLGIAALAIAGITGSFIAATPARAQVATCSDYIGNGIYPGYGSPGTTPRFKVCFPAGQTVDTQRRNDMFNAIQQLPKKATGSTVLEVRDVLETAGVTYHYFYDRDYYNTYVSATYPGKGFEDTGVSCGITNTTVGGTIIVAVFEVCELNYKTPHERIINPDLVRATFHETGHALDFALGKLFHSGAKNNPSRSTAWKTLMQYDIEHNLTPSDWATKTTTAKQSWMCSIFKDIALSHLEENLGAQQSPAQVCTGSPLVMNSYYVGKEPRTVYEQRLPYFVGNTSGVPTDFTAGDLWSQLFVIRHNTIGSAQVNFLKETDQALGFGTYNTTTAAFRCTKIAMQNLYLNPDVNPPASAFTGTGCPAVTW